MCALVSFPLFPNFGWPSTGEYGSYYLAGDLRDFCFVGGTGIDNNPVVIKKFNHNASERHRRRKINSLFSSLRSSLPTSDPLYLEILREYVRNLAWE
ncbi:unnamed protein product [Eruca vesicaria subsp. sativa]|uniref:BHLH domain-containing protein n=1 Tax=Eruca vesicaria subsp. sativa TaxID=29727 RepID=A0ABC8M8L3_ERUVS|nr:unnamed protein product [Eruca vesicaria subsp. sativa]